MVISFNNSLIGSGVTKNQRYLITVWKKSDMCHDTLDILLRVIAWSFNALQTGVDLVVYWEGKDLMCEDPMYLAAKHKAILTHTRGDWEFHANAFSLPKWSNVARMCWLCRATGTEGHELSHGRCDRDAPWKSTRVTHESWRSELLDNGQELPSFSRYMRGWRMESIVIDSLHTAELGTTAHVAGKKFQLCINALVFGATVDAKVKNLASDLDAWEGEAREDGKSFQRKAHERPHLLLEQLAKTPHQRCHCAMPGPVRSGISTAASGTPGATGLSVAGAVLHSAGFGGTVPLARCQSRDAGAGSSLLQRILETRGGSSVGETEALESDAHAAFILHLCEWQSASLGNPRFFGVAQTKTWSASSWKWQNRFTTMSSTAIFKWLTFCVRGGSRGLMH